MNDFVYRTATDEQLADRHAMFVKGELGFDSTMVAIMTGAPYSRVKAMGTDPSALTLADIASGARRREMVEIKLGRTVTPFDVVREFGDEDAAAGRLDDASADA